MRRNKEGKMPWVLRLPMGLQLQPGTTLIGITCAIVGLSYALDLSEGGRLATELPGAHWTLNIWGIYLLFTGLMVAITTIRQCGALERLALRLLSIGLCVWVLWLVIGVGLFPAIMTISLSLAFVGFAEIRAARIKVLLIPKDQLGGGDGD